MTGMSLASCLYEVDVVHRRLRPVPHRLAYRLCYALLDLDELPALDRRLRLFGYRRPGLFAFRDSDHGDGGGRLREWVGRALLAADIADDGGPVRLLCLPRLLGYAFNPLSVYFCHRRDGPLAGIVYEVNNTFGERHAYVVPAASGTDGVLRHRCDKRFHVSPFLAVAGHYDFRLRPPADRIAVAIRHGDCDGPLLVASLAGRRVALNDRALLRMLLRYPLMTVQVTAAIHWEALKLWRKRAPYFRRPEASGLTMSVGGRAPAGRRDRP